MSGRRFAVLAAAVLLPPLGVFLDRGLWRDFWIAAALTLVGFIPGMAWALYVILIDNRPAIAA